MPRKGENIFKRKDGRWEARYIHHYENGQARYGYLYGRTYAEAKTKKQEMMAITPEAKAATPKGQTTFEQLAKLWLSNVRISVKESTFTRYVRIVNKYILPHVGETETQKVDSFVINTFTDLLLNRGGLRGPGLAPKTVSDVLCVTKSIIRFGQRNGYKFGNTECIQLPQRSTKKIEILKSDNRIYLERVLMDSEDTTALGILFSLFLGVRIGELCGLRWEDVDLETGTVTVARTVERIADLDPNNSARTKVVISEPKTENSIRQIPLPGFLAEHLLKFRRREGYYIITDRQQPVEPHCFYIRYKNYMRKYDMDGYSFHALRHTFATRCVEQGFDTKSLSEILGHSNIATTLALYVHPSMEQKRAQMEKLAPSHN